ncbi:hypothetical protein FACS1894166_07340 [Bacilli bacterium]|nr:hypothetical protein FACS1894166_07340 [Bacilli bacterium]
MFTFLKNKSIDFPRTTNIVEGGVNSPIRAKLFAHKGMPEKYQQQLVEMYLFSRSEFYNELATQNVA